MAMKVAILDKNDNIVGKGTYDPGSMEVTLSNGTKHTLQWLNRNKYTVVPEDNPPPTTSSTKVADDYSSIARRLRELETARAAALKGAPNE